MAYETEKLNASTSNKPVLSADELRQRIERLISTERPRCERLWAYFRNPMRIMAVDANEQGSSRPYRQAQEWGLPSRLTGVRSGSDVLSNQAVDDVSRKEIVIENDIGWRVETMVDYLFGRSLVITSLAAEAGRRESIQKILELIFANNGGIQFLQQLALMGAIYGFVDVMVTIDLAALRGLVDSQNNNSGDTTVSSASSENEGAPTVEAIAGASQPDFADSRIAGASTTSHEVPIERLARMIRLEIVEPTRAMPFLASADYRQIEAYGKCYEINRPAQSQKAGLWNRVRSGLLAGRRGMSSESENRIVVTEIITANQWQRYEDEVLVAEGVNSLGRVPVVHIQNTAVPFAYSGASDVEPLIPLQDELNTRLSDRANRITLQSFKMYLGKGIDGFNEMPVAPGRMWMTDNPDADVLEFGGDQTNPSEESHLADIREALDKTSGVAPIAAGIIKNRLGRLTSAAALRITLMSLLAKTDRKRTTYGMAIEQICDMALSWLDKAGVFATTEAERRVELNWPSPLPENESEKLDEAEVKVRLGVPQNVVLRELGY